jgi:protease I
MAKDLTGRVIAFLVADEGTEKVELTQPWQAAVDAGATPVLVSPKPGKVWLFDHLDRASQWDVDEALSTARPERFDALVLPGGVANPDRLRTDPDAVRFVRRFIDDGKPVAAICHGPWTLIETGTLDGRTLTSWPSLQTDLRNAGANWVDKEVVVCTEKPSTLVSSRKPDDLDAFCEAYIEQIA